MSETVAPAAGTVLEIGAGTGQHAAYFAQHLPHLTWLATDREENLDGIRSGSQEALCRTSESGRGSMSARSAWPVIEHPVRVQRQYRTHHELD